MSEQNYEFGPFVFDGTRMILQKNGAVKAIGLRGAALLRRLLVADGQAVSKGDLMDAAWNAEFVEESNLTVQIAALRKCLGQNSDGQEWIATVQRVGYQFVYPQIKGRASIFAGAPDKPLSSVQKPSIVVLPFANMSADSQFDFFADATTEDIIMALSRVHEFFVISRTTSFAYKQRAVQAQEVSQELGVRYLLEGSVRVSGQRLRVTAQLIDGHSGGHMWSERFESEITEIFSVQDEIARSIALAMQVKLSYGDLARLWEGQTRNLQAWEKMAQGREFFLCFDEVNVRHAQTALKNALSIDPRYTGAMVQLGLCYWWQARYDTSVDKEMSLRLCEEQAQSALAIDPNLGSAYMLLGGNAFLRDQHAEAVQLCEKSIELSPSDSWAMAFLGLVCTYGGKNERAVEVLKTALRLSPRPIGWYIESYALAHLWHGDYATAQAAFEEQLEKYPSDVNSLMHVATVYGFQKRFDDAKRVVTEIKAKHPAYRLTDVRRTERYNENEKIEMVVSMLRQAGLSE
jgi:TolB-like protein/cytochrome c-type biogenesis protein CcmH/NrfG